MTCENIIGASKGQDGYIFFVIGEEHVILKDDVNVKGREILGKRI